MPWTLCGSVSAIRSVRSSNANGIAPTRSSTGSGISLVASGEMPRRPRGRRAAGRGSRRAARARSRSSRLAVLRRSLARRRKPPGESRVVAAPSPVAVDDGVELGRRRPRRREDAVSERRARLPSWRRVARCSPRLVLRSRLAGRRGGSAWPANSATTPPSGEERPERDRHLPRRLAVAGEQDDGRHERGEHADHQRRPAGVRAEHGAEQQRELHVAHAHPARVGERGEEEEERAAPSAAIAHRARGRATVCAASTTAAAGSTMRFGMTRRSRSVTRDRDERGAEERPRRRPRR